ncbi:hypothetical protein GCM10010464_19410 [Pseudonocardia yunnanensis]|uniref:Uncharacterized protein n=1 Tax=Pseudonocardia yunnanensis TaxID=58107 RepID=A0ABW4ERK0_9PSEU
MLLHTFTVADTADPTTGRAKSRHEWIRNTVEPAVTAEEVGLDIARAGAG